ncbi:hypothetical protein [Microvirga flavescens]|uniref:hypothetical protein n=1 Tax=Microvirga flavescens TaxID=2249811 RepID=UPI000DD5594F|nr:hypothetical protein [Microvirga flavescens]
MGAYVLSLSFKLTITFFGIYGMGSMARQNPKIDAAIALIESGYGSFNDRLKRASIQEGLNGLKKAYGWAAVTALVAFFIFRRSIEADKPSHLILSVAFLASFFGWFSIRWSTEHKKELAEFKPLIMGLFGPLVLGIVDLLYETHWVNIFADPFYIAASAGGFNLPRIDNHAILGGIVSAIFAVSLAVMYLLTWLLVAPIAFASVALIALPIWFARLVDLVAPKKAFPGFVIIILIAATLWDWASQ